MQRNNTTRQSQDKLLFFPRGLQGQLLLYINDSNYEKIKENTLTYYFDYVIFFSLRLDLRGISEVQNEKSV